jgi:LuxR family maltose regulon positive regulatory protein
LLEILSRAPAGHIVSACAPPGFGKSVLLTAWHAAIRANGRPAAWLTVDSADGPGIVVQFLAFACHHAGLDVAGTGLLDSSTPTLPSSLALQALLGAIERAGNPWYLVIDDADRASKAVVHEVFGPLARFLPANLTVAFASRDPEILDLSDFEQRGLVLRIDSAALRFTREEVRELWGRSVTESQVRSVEQRSGGWPALLQLMLQKGSTPHFDSAATPARGAAAVAAFFESRLLARLDPDTRRVLLSLTLLDRFSPSIAREITGAAEVDTALDRLIAVGVVTRSTNEDGIVYTIHSLLRSYLASRFAAEQPDASRNCHATAARVFLRMRRPVQAVKHAAATGEMEFLGDIVEAIDPLMLGITEGFPRLRQIVRLVPDSLARARPRIGYACVASAIKAGRLRDAKQLFTALEGTPPREALGTQSASVIAFERALCHSLLAVYKGTPIHDHDIAALDAPPADDSSLAPFVRSLAETLRSFIQAQAGHFTDAKASAWRAIEHADEAGSPYAAFFMYCDLGMITGIEGDAAGAVAFFDRGVEACASPVRLDERLTYIRDAFRLELEHEIAPLDAARSARLKNICVRLPTLEGWLDVYSAAFRTYSEQLFVGGDLAAALAILSAGVEHLREQEIEAIPSVLVAQRALLLALSGDAAAARAELTTLPAADLDPIALALHPWRVAEAFTEAQAAIHLAAGERLPPLDLDLAIDRAASSGNVRSEVRFRRLRAAFAERSTLDVDPTENDSRLRELEDRSGFRRSASLYERGDVSVSGTTRLPGPRTAVALAPRRDFFSGRELDVLARLERGLSDKVIAMDLGITAHGVRYHLKRIYAKLHARDRGEARTKAARLGLV